MCLQPVSWRCERIFVKCRLGLVVYKTNHIDSHCFELILSPRAKHFWGISNFDNWDQMSGFWGLTIMPGAELLCPVGSNCTVKNPSKCQGTMHLSRLGSGWVCVQGEASASAGFMGKKCCGCSGVKIVWVFSGCIPWLEPEIMNQGWALGLCKATVTVVQTAPRGAAAWDEPEPSSADSLGRTCAACTLPARYRAFVFAFPAGV